MLPRFCPASPPAKAELPPVTLPSAYEFLIVEPVRFCPTSPPTELSAPPLTLAAEPDCWMRP